MDTATLSTPIATTSTVSALRGRVAVVTGSTSGIGLGIARALAREGADLVLNGFGEARAIEDLVGEIAATNGVRCVHAPADLSRVGDVESLVAQAQSALGPVDILVNNAGIQHVAPIDGFPIAKWEAILALNLTAAFVATRAVLPDMKRRKWGRIVNIASAHGLVASPFKSAYVAAKHGLVGLGKVTALETAEYGITCNTVCPGYVWTPLVEHQIEEQAKAHGIAREQVVRDVLLKPQPNKRFATVEEIGALVAFLCANGASMTGSSVAIDGGWTAQ